MQTASQISSLSFNTDTLTICFEDGRVFEIKQNLDPQGRSSSAVSAEGCRTHRVENGYFLQEGVDLLNQVIGGWKPPLLDLDIIQVFGPSFPSWREMLEKLCDRIEVQASIGDYQGEDHYLLRKGDRWQHINLGYGSCSSCDHWQSLNEPSTPAEDRNRAWLDLKNRVEQGWKTKAEMRQYLFEHDWAGSWYGREKSVKFVAEALIALGGR